MPTKGKQMSDRSPPWVRPLIAAVSGVVIVSSLLIGASICARAQQAPEHVLRLTDQDINVIRAWGQERPFKESADLMLKIYNQLTTEQMQRDAQNQAQQRAAVEADLKAKEDAAKKPAEPAK